MHTKQSGELCYSTTAHTNQAIGSQALNFHYYERMTMRLGMSVVDEYSMRNIVTMTEYERYVITRSYASMPSMDNIGLL
jgi:hypothetical protein